MAAQYQLVMHSGPTPGKTFPLEGDVITIGREAGNGITINDAEISRKHSQFVFQGGKYILTDLGSTNGTFVNGQRVTGQHILQPGEVISLGEQINLLFESLTPVDPNATMLSSSRAPVAAVPAPKPATPAPVPAPQPAVYAGHIPAGPGPGAAAPTPAAGAPNRTPIIIGVVIVLLLCCCVGGLIAYDQMNLWCSPLTSWLVPVIGGACP